MREVDFVELAFEGGGGFGALRCAEEVFAGAEVFDGYCAGLLARCLLCLREVASMIKVGYLRGLVVPLVVRED